MSESAAPLGIFGGTFDPLHVGHLRLAIEAREALGLGEVRFVPAGNPPLRAAPGTPAADRLAMVERALAGVAGFAVDSAEVRAAADGRPSYTVDSLERLRRALEPDRPLVLLLGADAFARLDAWHRWRDLFDLAHIAVATRAGHELKVGRGEAALDLEFRARTGTAADLATAASGRIVPFAITALEVSASALRETLGRGGDIRYLVPPAVLDYIESRQLYRTPHGH